MYESTKQKRVRVKKRFDSLITDIHTSQVTVKGLFGKDDFLPEDRDCITVIRTNVNKTDLEKCRTTFKINLHRPDENGCPIRFKTFIAYMAELLRVLEGAGIAEYRIDRLDICFDSYDPEHYHKYEKPYRLVVAGISVSNEMKNNYRTMDLFNPVQISVVTKSGQIEAEHYDRLHKNIVFGYEKDPSCSRFEIRSKKWEDQNIKKEFLVNWFRRLDTAIDARAMVERKYNEALTELYHSQVDQSPKRFRNIYDFLMINQDYIYSRKQILQLVDMIELNQDKASIARNFRNRYGVEYVENADLEALVSEMKERMTDYFEG